MFNERFSIFDHSEETAITWLVRAIHPLTILRYHRGSYCLYPVYFGKEPKVSFIKATFNIVQIIKYLTELPVVISSYLA